MKKINYKKEGYLLLGLCGWVSGSHDASAVLVEVSKSNCKIIAALEEEKVIGRKCAYDTMPQKAVADILKMTSIRIKDIDEIVFGWDYPRIYSDYNLRWPFYDNKELLNQLFCECDENCNLNIPISFVKHHLSHAASSYRVSNFEEAITIVIDGNGESESTSIWICHGDDIKELEKYSIESSFGYLFEATNILLGFRANESGKTMGLSAYGKPLYSRDILNCYINDSFAVKPEISRLYQRIKKFNASNTVNQFQDSLIKQWLLFFKNELNIEINKNKIQSFYNCENQYKDLASSIQKSLESKIIYTLKRIIKQTGIHNVCIAGGVGLNCTMNGKLLELDEVSEIFTQPSAGDAGVALGCALERAYQLGLCSRTKTAFSPYLGIECSDDEIKEFLEKNNIPYRYYNNGEEIIAKELTNGGIIALFQGRNEWGPRSLGNRSIISLPKKGQLDIINEKVKNRELGRPLAPSLHTEDYIYLNEKVKQQAKYMNIAFCADKVTEEFASVIHVDMTYRPQFVDPMINQQYYDQLSAIKKQKGNSIIINTSFNLLSPIIYNLEQAIEFFNKGTLSMLALNNRWILM